MLEQDVREHAHRLINFMPVEQVSAMVGMLESMMTPLQRVLANAPLDDEPYEPIERTGQLIPHSDILAEFGLSEADFEEMGRTPIPEGTAP